MLQLLDLPVLILAIIFDYLPVWKIRQLACLCRALNNAKNMAFTRRRHLSLCCEVVSHKARFNAKERRFIQLKHIGQFDLNISFMRFAQDPLYDVLNDILCEDMVNLEVPYPLLGQMFPNISHLTLAVVSRWWLDDQAELLNNWPQLTSLKLFNASGERLNWRQIGPAINQLNHLEHLVLSLDDLEWDDASYHMAPLIERGNLKTLIARGEIIDTIVNRRAIEQLQTIGISDWYLLDHLENHDRYDRHFLSKLKRLDVNDYCYREEDIRSWNLTNWASLQYVHLVIPRNATYGIEMPLRHLSALPNLKELDIATDVIKPKIDIPSEEICKSLPKLVSVRTFRLVASIDAHQFRRLAHAFPDTTELILELWMGGPGALFEISMCDSLKEYLDDDDFMLSVLCPTCKQTMERADEKHGTNIQSFNWFVQQTQCGEHELIPKVMLFSTEIEGKRRINFDYHPID